MKDIIKFYRNETLNVKKFFFFFFHTLHILTSQKKKKKKKENKKKKKKKKKKNQTNKKQPYQKTALKNIFKFVVFRPLLLSGQTQQTTRCFSQKIGFDISCKLSSKETKHEMSKAIFEKKKEKKKENISKCCLLKFLPSMLSVKYENI